MSPWEKLAENRIQEAIESGDLAQPAGGPPLDLSDYFALPASERAGTFLLRNAGVVPPEIELLRHAAALEKQLENAKAESVTGLRARLQEVRVAFCMAMERRKRTGRE